MESKTTIDCYVIKYKGYYDMTQNDKQESCFVYDKNNHKTINISNIKNEFIECIHVPSLKQISFSELELISEKFAKEDRLDRLKSKELELLNDLQNIKDQITQEKELLQIES